MIRTLGLVLAVAPLLGASQPDRGDTPPAARQCIDLNAIITRRAIDGETIRFELSGGAAYLNRLGGRCPGLEQNSRGFGALAFDVYGGQLCRGDRVRVIDSTSPRAYANAIACPLGDFVPAPRDPAR